MAVPKEPVLLVVQHGKSRFRQGDKGLINRRHIEALRGVQTGDRVVVSGQNPLNEITPVTTVSN
jgi:hypothetical protein